MLKNSLLKWLSLSCLSYFIISFTMNMIYWITSQKATIMLFNHNLVILLFCFLIVAIVCILMYKPKTATPKVSLLVTYRFAIFYTLISFSMRIYALIDKEKASVINDSYMLLIIAGISLVISLCVTFIKIKNFFLKSLFYFVILGFSWAIIFIFKVNYTNNPAIVAMLIFIGAYLLITLTIYFFFIRKRMVKQNENKKYKSMFK